MSMEALEREVAARRAAEEEFSRQRAELESEIASARRKTASNSKEDPRFAVLEAALEEARRQKEQLAEEVERITEEKEQLENQYDDALNNTLISFKSPARPQGSTRKSVGRLSLSGYADEFASLGVSNAELEALNKRTAELEHIVERQAEEIERLIKKGSVDDSYDMEGLDQRFVQVSEQLDFERQQATKYREETSRLSGLVESLNSERGVLMTRVRKYQEEELAFEATSAELESLQAECLGMRSEVETYKKRIFNADIALEQLNQNCETTRTQCFQAEERLKAVERDLESAKHDNKALDQVHSRKNTVLNTELNTARSEIRKLREESGDAKTLNHKLRQENIDLSTNLQRWQSRSAEFETKHHESESEAKRARGELESIKRETAISLRNSEVREKELSATLADNQNQFSALGAEVRSVKSEREHLLNQVRNLTDQVHEMKHSAAELMVETAKKHEAELGALRQKSGELESLLQSSRREKSHYESQLKAVQKQVGSEVQAAQARVKELEQALETQKKLNARREREEANGAVVLVEQVEASSLLGGKQITVLGSPPVVASKNNTGKARADLQSHVSQPLLSLAEPALSSPPAAKKLLQRHPTAPSPPVTATSTKEAVASNPLAFWRAKISSTANQQQQQTKPPLARTVTPVLTRKPIAGTTPAAIPSPLIKVRPHVSVVQEVRKELEQPQVEETADLSVQLSPIMAARSGSDVAMIEEEEPNKENSDAFSRAWETALASRPLHWRNALTRTVEGGPDSFRFGSKNVLCRMIGNDMLVIDGKTQMLLDRFLDQHGDPLTAPPETAAPLEAAKKAGLRFKNLKKQPLLQPNDLDSQA